MPFEYNDNSVKATLLIQKMVNGKFRLAGFVRLTDLSGDATLRLTQNVDAAMVFDQVEFVAENNDDDTEQGLTKFHDWGVRTA